MDLHVHNTEYAQSTLMQVERLVIFLGHSICICVDISSEGQEKNQSNVKTYCKLGCKSSQIKISITFSNRKVSDF